MDKPSQKPYYLNKNVIMIILWILIFLSFPSGVLCGVHEIVDDISFVVLIIIFLVFLCSVIGFYSRRITAMTGGISTNKNSIFK